MKARYEFRFLISSGMALRVRDLVTSYIDLDQHCVGRPDYSYPVHTIELDSTNWNNNWHAAIGEQDVWKLRLRYYDGDHESPVFCESLHQIGDVNVKHRCAVHRTALPKVLNGQLPNPEEIPSGARDLAEMQQFVALLLRLKAEPKLHTCCLREAYECWDRKSRVTLDRHIAVSQGCDDLLSMEVDRPLHFKNDQVLLELRFIERFPDWYRFMVESLGLSALVPWSGDRESLCSGGIDTSLHDLPL